MQMESMPRNETREANGARGEAGVVRRICGIYTRGETDLAFFNARIDLMARNSSIVLPLYKCTDLFSHVTLVFVSFGSYIVYEYLIFPTFGSSLRTLFVARPRIV